MHNLVKVVALGGVLALGVFAQGRYDRDPYYRGGPNYDRYSGERYDRGSRGGDLVQRVQADLQRAGSEGYRGSDYRRANDAINRLSDFQNHWQRGHFDKGKLDRAISSVQHVIDNNRMDRHDRRVLMQDVEALRDFRAQSYGYRGYR